MAEQVDPFEAEFGPRVSGALHGSAAPSAPSSVDPFEAEFLPRLNAALAPSGQTLQQGTIPSGWNAGYNTLDATLLGFPHAVAPLISPAGNIMGAYQKRLDALNAARNEWSKENPISAMGTEVAGGALGTIGAMALGQEYLAAPAAARLAAAVPKLAPALDFAGGTAGAFNKGVGPALLRTGSLATRGAGEGAAAGLLQSGLGNEPTGDQVEGGALAGAVLNPLLGRFAPKSAISPEIASAVQGAIKQGVPMRAGRVPGVASPVTSLDQLFNAGNEQEVRRGFDKALTTHAGVPADSINQAWVAKADALNSGTMGRVAGRYEFDGLDPKTNGDLASLDARAQGNLSPENYEKFAGLKKKIDNALAAGSVPGSVYQGWTQQGGLISNYAKDPNLRPFVTGPGGLRDIIDNGWERSIASSPSPTAQQDYAAWQQARKQYKNTRIIDDTLNEAGDYNPQKLLPAVQKRYGSAMKAGELGDLAITGQFISKPEAPPAKSSSLIAKAGAHPIAATGAGALAGSTLSPMIEHSFGGFASHIAENPWESAAIAGSGALGIGAIGKSLASFVNSPLYTKHLLDIAQGTKPWLRGVNPAIPVGSDLATHRQIGTGQ